MAIKHLKTLFPIPRKWTDDEKAFALRLEEMYKEIQIILNRLTVGQGVAENADLNTMKEIGTYYFDSSVTGTCSNCPISSGGFAMYVIRRRESIRSVSQIILTGNSVYVRHSGSTSSSGWTAWRVYSSGSV